MQESVVMSEIILQCWNCKEELELDSDFDTEDPNPIECGNCGEICVVRGNRTISTDEDYEGRCDSEASKRYEEAAYGRRDDN
jgi:predicted RNA-binding Zn-ribbon protein involved in translation (DUF1610 family)